MSKALANALTLALVESGLVDSIGVARDFATQFFEDNVELLGPPVIVDMQGRALSPQPVASPGAAWKAGDTVKVREEQGSGDNAVAARFLVAQRGPDGLTANQRQGIDRGLRLCQNCQQPQDDNDPPYFGHAPGCSRIPGVGADMRAVTKTQLPPLS